MEKQNKTKKQCKRFAHTSQASCQASVSRDRGVVVRIIYAFTESPSWLQSSVR